MGSACPLRPLRSGVSPKPSRLHSWSAPPSDFLSTCLHFSGVKKSRRGVGSLAARSRVQKHLLSEYSVQLVLCLKGFKHPTTGPSPPPGRQSLSQDNFLVPKHIYNAHIHAHVPKSSGPSGGEEKPRDAPEAVSLSPPGSGSRLRERGSARGRQPSLPPPRSLGEGDPSAGGMSL